MPFAVPLMTSAMTPSALCGTDTWRRDLLEVKYPGRLFRSLPPANFGNILDDGAFPEGKAERRRDYRQGKSFFPEWLKKDGWK